MAWEIFPWPCIGQFWFLSFGLSLHPLYDQLLARLKSSAFGPRRLLDVGTCLGQDLRHLVHVGGVPAPQLFGTDIIPAFEEAGCALFNDADRFGGQFIAADFLAGNVNDNPLAARKGGWDVLTATMFLHALDLPAQRLACGQMISLLRVGKEVEKEGDEGKDGEEGWIMGGLVGTMGQATRQRVPPPFAKEGEESWVWRHNVGSFVEMWKSAAEEAQRKVEVWAEYETQKDEVEKRDREREKRFFTEKEATRIWFLVKVRR